MIRQVINRLIDFCCCWARDQSREEKFRELAIKEYNELLEHYRQHHRMQNRFSCCNWIDTTNMKRYSLYCNYIHLLE